MAKRNDEVLKAVADALTKNPSADLQSLFEKAKAVDPAVGELSLRQFNARYPLQVKRQRSGSKPGRKPGGGKAQTRRGRAQAQQRSESLRKLFYEFAEELAAAGNKSEVVGVLSKVEQYAQRVEELFPKR